MLKKYVKFCENTPFIYTHGITHKTDVDDEHRCFALCLRLKLKKIKKIIWILRVYSVLCLDELPMYLARI